MNSDLVINDTIRIGELAERSHTTPETIRYYEGLGLLGHAKRGERNHRRYDHESIVRLEKIAILKNLGLSLEEIADVIDLYFEDSKSKGIKAKRKVLDLLQGHLLETEGKLKTLQAFRDDLLRGIARIEGIIHMLDNEG